MLLLLNFPVSFRKIFVLNILNYHKHESYYGVKGAYCNKLADFIIARCKWKSSTDGTCMGNGPPKSCGGPSIEILLTRHYLIWLVFPTFRFVVVANYWSPGLLCSGAFQNVQRSCKAAICDMYSREHGNHILYNICSDTHDPTFVCVP